MPREALSVKSLAAQVGESGSRREAETGFFRPVPDQAAKYHEARVYPQGRLFPFSSYAGRTPHSTMRGLYLSDPESLAGVHAAGLKAVVSVGAPKVAWGHSQIGKTPTFTTLPLVARKHPRTVRACHRLRH
jgi:hypothetical protein